MILLGIIVFFTVFEALHEGFALNGKGTLAGVIEFIKLFILTLLVPFLMWYSKYDYYFQDWRHVAWFLPQFIFGWIFIRYAIFDFIHNAAAHLNLYHIGTVKLYDKLFAWLMNKKIKQPRPEFFWITRILLLAAGVSLILHL